MYIAKTLKNLILMNHYFKCIC